MAVDLTRFLEELKNKVNIVDVVSRYVTLQRKGSKYWGCCPFHHEKTPSFSVDEVKQFYFCFGCKEAGDVLKFIQKVEATDFLGAVNILANIAGVSVPELKSNSGEDIQKLKKKKERLYALLKDTAKYYNKNLNEKYAGEQLKYLKARGISPKTMRKFGLGYSLDWDSVISYLKTLGYSEEEMIEAGVAGKNQEKERVYDAYAMRIIIPIIDSFGQVVAFGGRTLEKSAIAKYKNTSDTPVFNKKRVLYGLNLVKKEKLKSEIKNLIVVEGYMDAISVYEAGFHNVVATMGTALTREQAKLMRHITEEVLLCYDGDSAGVKGSILGMEILKKEGINAKVVSFPNNLDPDEIIRKHGKDKFEEHLSNAKNITDFKIMLIKKKYSLDNVEEKQKYISNVLRVIGELDSFSEQERYLKILRDETGITYDSLKLDMEKVKKGEEIKISKKPVSLGEGDASVKRMRFLLFEVIEGKLSEKEIEPFEKFMALVTHLKIYSYLREKSGEQINANVLFDLVNESEQSELNEILEAVERQSITADIQEKYLSDCIGFFKKKLLEEEIEQLKVVFELETDSLQRKEITRRIGQLTKESKKA